MVNIKDDQKNKKLLNNSSSSSNNTVRKSKNPTSKIVRTKFVRTQKDSTLKDRYSSDFNNVYYALKRLSGKSGSGVTGTDLFIELNRRIKRKDIFEILDGASWSKKSASDRYVFYDKEFEERMRRQMEEALKKAENEFFTWLPTFLPPHMLDEVKNSYRTISSLLVQKKVLSKSIAATTQIGQIEDALKQVNSVFGGKKLRYHATKLLTAYLAFLREKKNTQSIQEDSPAVEIQEGWILFDFTNAQSFERTVPVYCSLNGTVVTGKNWARILLAVVENELARQNPALEELYKVPLYPNRANRPFFLKKKIVGLNCAEISNGYFVNINYSIPRLMEIIQAFCLHCGYNKKQVVLCGIPKETKIKDAVSKKPFDIQEAVILLDTYLLAKSNNLSRVEASDIASKRLRYLAEQSGISITDSFRSPAGLQGRLRSIEGLYEGKESSISSPGTEEFRLAVRLYRENNQLYQQILHEIWVPYPQSTEENFSAKNNTDYVFDSGNTNQNSSAYTLKMPVDPVIENRSSEPLSPKLAEAVDTLIRSASEGITKADICAQLSEYNTHQINLAITACHAVLILKKYYHPDNISDYQEMADILLEVITRQFSANGNYTSAQQLYNEARAKLDDFFFYNNAFDSRQEVYDLAVHLFVQEKYKGNSFIFMNNTHIWREEPDYPKDYHGLLIKYAREHGNVFSREEAVSYFDQIGSPSSAQTFSNVLFTTGRRSFLQYSENQFILTEALHVNDYFLATVKTQIENLFEGEDYIATGEIDDYFYTTLPSLSNGVSWSALLLEDFLRVYDIGFAALEAGSDNDKKTVPAAIVRKNSLFRTFGDVVWNEVSKAFTLPKVFTAQEFREFLLDKGFIRGSEKMYNVHKTVSGDIRFFWTDKNGKVTIN